MQAGGEEITLRVLGRAIAAAGGSDEQISLAKLELIVAALFEATPGTARWTLARAMITASEPEVTIEREPGREPLPRLEFSAGVQTCWDGRFWVSVGADVETGTIEVGPLGEGAARELLQQATVKTRVPAKAVGMVPSFWRGDRLLAVPSLGILVRSELPQHPGSTVCLERNREQTHRPKARKSLEMVRQLGPAPKTAVPVRKNASSGLKLGKDLLHSYVTCTTIPRSRRCGASPAPWGSGGLKASHGHKGTPMNSNFRNLAIWVVIALLLVALFNLFQNPGQSRRGNEISYSEFLAGIESGNVAEVTIAKHRISGLYRDRTGNFSTVAPEDPNLVERLNKKGVKITARPPEDDVPSILGVLVNWFPMLLLIGVWIFFMRQMQSGGGRAMGFGKSKAKLLTERQGRVTFEDVAGVDEAKSDLQEIVEFLRDPQKFQRLGGRIPRGCLLVGPPGTGKTLIARAVAGEANVPFFTISGSDFVEMFVGVGASRVRDMFEQAKKNAPCIIFIDEIDAVGRHRGAGLGGGNDEREQTLNQLLVEMDGFEANEGIIIIAATNRPDVLDPALLRPGRFDRQIMVPNPDVGGREKILKVHMRKVPLAPDVDPKVIARGTPGFSGADLANLVNEAALLAARRNKRLVTQTEFEDAKDKVMMGAERRSMIMTEEEKLATAYHETGHALVNVLVPGNDPLHKVTIIPRGRALGVTMSLPERDKLSYSKQWCEARCRHHVRRPRGRAAHLRRGPPQHRRLQRYHAGDRSRAPHGDRVGHEREARASALQRQSAGSLPGSRHHPAAEHVGGNGEADR